MTERLPDFVIVLMACAALAPGLGRSTEAATLRDHPLHAIIDVFEAPAARGAKEVSDAPVVRKAWPVRFALPVSRHSEIRDPSRITVQGSDLVEYTVTDRWPDGSVRWLQIDARVDFDPSKPSRSLLVTSGEPVLAEGRLARRDGKAVVVETGGHAFRIANALELGGSPLVVFSANVTGREFGATIESVEITEPGAMRTEVIARGRHDDTLGFQTRHTFFRDRGLVRIDHELMVDEAAAAPAAFLGLTARVSTPFGETSSGESWVSRGDGDDHLTMIAPTYRTGAQAPRMKPGEVTWTGAVVLPGQRLGFELWLDVDGHGASPAEIAHAVLNPLVARAVENAQYSDTATMPGPVLAPVAHRFFHARNKMPFDPTAETSREPADAVAESFYDGLRDTERPAEAFARSLQGLEDALAEQPSVVAGASLRGLALHARIRGDRRAVDAVRLRAALLAADDLVVQAAVARVMGAAFLAVSEDGLALPQLEGRFSVSELTETIRAVALIAEDGDGTSDDRLLDFIERASDLITRGAHASDGYRPVVETDGDAAQALGDASPLVTDVGAALIQSYKATGDRAVLERIKDHLQRRASLGGSAAPVRGDSLNHDLVHLMLNLPVTPTWRALPLDVETGADGAKVLSWTVPEGASRIRIKFADRSIVTPAIDEPVALSSGALPFAVAVNLDGEPAPAAPGTRQFLEVIGDASHFAARYLDVPQRVRREFERGPERTRIALPGWESAAAAARADGGAEDGPELPLRTIRFVLLSVVVLVLIVLAMRRS